MNNGTLFLLGAASQSSYRMAQEDAEKLAAALGPKGILVVFVALVLLFLFGVFLWAFIERKG